MEQLNERIAGLPEAQRQKKERTLRAADHLDEHFGESPGIVVVCFHPDRLAVTDARLDRVSVVGYGPPRAFQFRSSFSRITGTHRSIESG